MNSWIPMQISWQFSCPLKNSLQKYSYSFEWFDWTWSISSWETSKSSEHFKHEIFDLVDFLISVKFSIPSNLISVSETTQCSGAFYFLSSFANFTNFRIFFHWSNSQFKIRYPYFAKRIKKNIRNGKVKFRFPKKAQKIQLPRYIFH